jgi:hypothetical protein
VALAPRQAYSWNFSRPRKVRLILAAIQHTNKSGTLVLDKTHLARRLVYRTNKLSDVPMSSSVNLKLYYLCGYMGWHTLIAVYCVILYTTAYFYRLQVKMNHINKLQNMDISLGLLALLRTVKVIHVPTV